MQIRTFFVTFTAGCVAAATAAGLLVGSALTAHGAEQCPIKPYSVADAKGQEQLGACLRLANDMNVSAVQQLADAPVIVLRIAQGDVDSIFGVPESAIDAELARRTVEHDADSQPVTFVFFRGQHAPGYAMAVQALAEVLESPEQSEDVPMTPSLRRLLGQLGFAVLSAEAPKALATR